MNISLLSNTAFSYYHNLHGIKAPLLRNFQKSIPVIGMGGCKLSRSCHCCCCTCNLGQGYGWAGHKSTRFCSKGDVPFVTRLYHNVRDNKFGSMTRFVMIIYRGLILVRCSIMGHEVTALIYGTVSTYLLI